ncbi:MAG: NAD(P)/FAD-dependent oxidoreductase [Rhodothermales bacterium]
MSKRKKVVIIGGGAIGLCAAYYLHHSGNQVTVLEKSIYTEGTSLGNAGMLVPSHVVPLAAPGVISQGMRWLFKRDSPFRIKPRLDPALASWLWQFKSFCNDRHVDASMPLLRDLSLASVDLFEQLSETFLFHFERRGLLMVHSSEKGEKENLKYGKMAKQVGLEVEELSADALYKLEPGIKTNATGAVYYPQDAHISPNHFTASLQTHLSTEGVDFRTHSPVTEFTRRKGTIVSVKTPSEEFEADEVILAAGSWSPAIARLLGIKLPIQPAKGYSVTLDAPVNGPEIPMILTEAKVTITPMGNQLRFGGTLELAGFDDSIDRVRTSSILNTIPDYLPNIKPEEIQTDQIWSGYRPCTPDGLPMIGRSGAYSNLVIATGHAMIGITLAPITGQLVTNVVNQATPSINIMALKPERFDSKTKAPAQPRLKQEPVDAK